MELPYDRARERRRQKVSIFEGSEMAANQEYHRLLMLHGDTRSTGATVDVLMQRYMQDTTLAPRTREEFQRVIDRVIVPLFGYVKLSDLSRGTIKMGWKAGERDHTLHNLGKAHRVLRAALFLAMDLGWLEANPATKNGPRTPPKPKLAPPPTVAVQNALLRAVEKDLDVYVWLRLAMVTGARRGEVLALRWDDFDAERKCITYARAMTVVKGSKAFEKTTKTDLVKTVQLDRRMVAALRLLRYRQKRAAERNGYILTHDHLGVTPWRPDSVSRKFRRIREQVPGAEKVRLHDIRHAVATELFGAGFNARVVADHVGHEDTATTLGMYASSIPSQAREAAEYIGELLD